MHRTHVYLKVVLDLDEDDNPQRIAQEMVRALSRMYGVRTAEVSSLQED